MRSQTVIWTALPNGFGPGGTLKLSVFAMPRLQTDEGGRSPRLSLFPDFVNWPRTIQTAPSGPLSFGVSFGGGEPVDAAPDPESVRPSPETWAAIFDPATTAVQPWQFYDFSNVPKWSFPVVAIEAFLRDAYGSIGRQNPTAPFPDRQWLLDNPFRAARPGQLRPHRRPAKGLGARTLGPPPDPGGGPTPSPEEALAQALDFHVRPPHREGFSPPTPTLDFHEALSMFKAYPHLMRLLGLVFDITIPGSPPATGGNTPLRVVPTWQPLLSGPGTKSQDATPLTNSFLGPNTFSAASRGTDYRNGMLDLSDTTRFSVIEVDVDGAAERAAMFAASLEQTIAGGTDDTPTEYAPPSLRSLGLSLVRSGWAGALDGLAAVQAEKQYQLERHLADPANVAPPAFDAEDLVRGHRFDVYTLDSPAATWRSLVGRVGSYQFPRDPGRNFSRPDEGAVTSGATQAAGTIEPPPPDLYVHETLARWSGWSLAARRPGRQILPGPEEGVGGDPGNPLAPPDPGLDGVTTPQLSVTFSAPPNSLPKLRFGHRYRFRARAADLAGNGVPLSSTDDATATPPVTHLRFDPVVAPATAPTGPYGPGQGAQLIAILNNSDGTEIAPKGLWLFPPKASQLLAEEHGMFDGFVPGQPPDPSRRPSGDAATYNLIVAREPATLDNVPGVQRDPVQNTPFFTAAKLATPWLPDPMSAGVAMVALPGEASDTATTRDWAGGPWPDQEPLLLRLSPGADAAHTYVASTARASAVEELTLPPAGVADVALSSTLPEELVDLFGMWPWITDGLDPQTRAIRRTMAVDGRIWLLTPFRVVRFVHAVRLPLVPPEFGQPQVFRSYGSTKARFRDDSFKFDPPSTATLDVEGTWRDPVDDPSDPGNDPTSPGSVASRTERAFQLTVPDPSRPGPAFGFDPDHGAQHDLGDTKHHLVTYTATATSRFAELFRRSVPVTFAGTAPARVSDVGVNASSVQLTAADGTPLNAGTDFTVDTVSGEVTLLRSGVAQPVTVSFVPTDTVPGPPRQIRILASARPDPPKIARVVPAWQFDRRGGSVSRGDEVGVFRRGGFMRVYLERPWYSSGAGELLGVVTLPDNVTKAAPSQRPLVTLIGRDPITTSDSVQGYADSPFSTSAWVNRADVPAPPYYFRTAVVGLAEDPFGTYNVFPYAVSFDKQANLWFADVGLATVTEADAPAGLFVRLALVRFQPYAIPRDVQFGSPISQGAEVSPVVLATFVQPVPNRAVSVHLDPSDASKTKVNVFVTGPGYSGWRPPTHESPSTEKIQNDWNNRHALHPNLVTNSSIPVNRRDSSTVVVEVQVQDTSTGLSGDLAWVAAPGPKTELAKTFNPFDQFGNVRWNGAVTLPSPVGSRPMRLRISEVDFYTGDPAFTSGVDTRFRRPFVALIPLT
ncbi:MAG: hypothetical protein M3179_06680 [Actinomycetota bacterium]|nr:hypothetical protein [Actinomycetota bacterium]